MAGEGNRSPPGSHENGNSHRGHREGDSHGGRGRDKTENEARSDSTSPANVTSSTRRDMGGSPANNQRMKEAPGVATTERETGFMTTGQQVEGAPTAATTSWERSTTLPASMIEPIKHDGGSSANSQKIEEVLGVATASMKRDLGSPTLPAWILESIRRDLTPHTVPAAAMPSVERAVEEQVGINEPQTKKTDAQVSHPEPPAEPARGCGLRRDL
ncbi:hypothetical protein V2G26_016687 [Clonostachys chloroleuca]